VKLRPTEIIDSGIDWITLSFTDQKRGQIALTKASLLFQQEHSAGDDKHTWNLFGYEGFRCGGIRFGTRYDSALIQLSGPLAQQHWNEFLPLSTNCSRLDLQVTARYDLESSSIIARHYKTAVRGYRKTSGSKKVTLLRSTDGSSTIYIGSRLSERFGRVYQKDRESRLEHYQNSVRYELELKGKTAVTIATQLSTGGSPGDASAQLVTNWFNDASIYYLLPEHDRDSFIRVSRKRRDASSRLEWLTTDVRPAVKNLLERGYYNEVMIALGLTEQLGQARELIDIAPTGQEWRN
jgi:DNA relaxase NicK